MGIGKNNRNMYPKCRFRVHIEADMYPICRFRVHIDVDMYPICLFWVHIGPKLDVEFLFRQ